MTLRIIDINLCITLWTTYHRESIALDLFLLIWHAQPNQLSTSFECVITWFECTKCASHTTVAIAGSCCISDKKWTNQHCNAFVVTNWEKKKMKLILPLCAAICLVSSEVYTKFWQNSKLKFWIFLSKSSNCPDQMKIFLH